MISYSVSIYLSYCGYENIWNKVISVDKRRRRISERDRKAQNLV